MLDRSGFDGSFRSSGNLCHDMDLPGVPQDPKVCAANCVLVIPTHVIGPLTRILYSMLEGSSDINLQDVFIE
jgi:hypothetical protein